MLIEFAPDPGIIIREEMPADNYRGVIGIEVKGGSDFSNIHDHIGDAEKCHHKANAAGYVKSNGQSQMLTELTWQWRNANPRPQIAFIVSPISLRARTRDTRIFGNE